MALSKSELALLGLLRERDTEQGVFFARWDEIRSRKYPEEWLQANEGAPELDWTSERLLIALVEQGLAVELESWATTEGKHFRITASGLASLEEADATLVQRSRPIIQRFVLWVLSPLVVAWLLYLFGPNLGILEALGIGPPR